MKIDCQIRCDNNICHCYLGKTEKIDENKSWYFIIQLCEVKGTNFEIDNVDPKLLQ